MQQNVSQYDEAFMQDRYNCMSEGHPTIQHDDLIASQYQYAMDYSDPRRQTGGKVIFTLGGGYSLHAASRVWAILYLVVNDLAVPRYIPAAWSQRWERHLDGKPCATLHDPDAAQTLVPQREEIARRNRVVASRLLEALSRYWV